MLPQILPKQLMRLWDFRAITIRKRGETQIWIFGHPKLLIVLLWWIVKKCVPGTFSGCCQQTFSAPRQFPLKLSPKIPVLKDRVCQRCKCAIPQDPQNLLISTLVNELQLPRPQTWPAWQTEHACREGRHIRPLCAVVVISGTAVVIGKHQARRFAGALCLRLANKHN
jgi:hypothetical protein